MWFWKLLKLGRHVLQPYRRTERHVDAEGVRGVRLRQNRTEIRINTAQNNIRKLQTALKLAENFWIPQTAWFCTTAKPQPKKKFPQNRTKNGAKPHHRKPLVFNRRSYMSKVMDCTPCWQKTETDQYKTALTVFIRLSWNGLSKSSISFAIIWKLNFAVNLVTSFSHQKLKFKIL